MKMTSDSDSILKLSVKIFWLYTGLLARQRKEELQRVNEQLRQINAALRRQAKIESYAPSLSYAPVGSRVSENEVIVNPKKQELMSHLKAGKNFLRNQDLEKAFMEFKMALEIAQNIKDPIEEKKAARGVGLFLFLHPILLDVYVLLHVYQHFY